MNTYISDGWEIQCFNYILLNNKLCDTPDFIHLYLDYILPGVPFASVSAFLSITASNPEIWKSITNIPLSMLFAVITIFHLTVVMQWSLLNSILPLFNIWRTKSPGWFSREKTIFNWLQSQFTRIKIPTIHYISLPI